MDKTDLVKQDKTYYTAKKTPGMAYISPAVFLAIEGKGDPNGPDFVRKVQALYVGVYAVKFHYKSKGHDFVVPKLEGLWWFDKKKYSTYNMSEAPVKIPREQWYYRLLIRVPPIVSEREVLACINQVRAKKELTELKDIHLVQMEEGDCVQVLHVGPFDTEPQTLQLVDGFIKEKGLKRNGLHHEIYLSDFRKTSPEKLRTILREPVKKVNG